MNISFDRLYRTVPGTASQIEGGVPDRLSIAQFKNLTEAQADYKRAHAFLSFLQARDGTAVLNAPLIVSPSDETICPLDELSESKERVHCSRRFILKGLGTIPIVKPDARKYNKSDDLSNTFFTVYNMPIYDTWRFPVQHHLYFNRSKDCRQLARWDLCARNFLSDKERFFLIGGILLWTLS